MQKKILIIGVCLVVVLVIGGGVFGINAMIKKDPGAAYIKITAIPTKIANVIIPPPKLENKEPEERKKIIIKYLKEMEEAEEWWQLLKMIEIEKRILKMGDLIVPTLIEIIRDSKQYSDSRMADSVLNDIIEWKNTPVDEICRMDGDWGKKVYGESVRLAKKIDIESMVPRLIEVACSKNKDIVSRGNAMDILGRLKDKRAVEPLIKLLEDKEMIIPSISVLGDIGDKRAGKMIIRRMESYRFDKDTYELCIKALGQVGGKEPIAVLMNLFKENPRDKVVMEALGTAKAEEAVPMLIELLEREIDRSIRAIMITTLGCIGSDEAVDALINSQKEEGGGIIIIALGKTKNKKAIPFLEDLLKSNDEYDRKWAAESLKKITGKEYKYKR